MRSRKTTVFWYKERCSPRILVNPSKEALELAKSEGTVLINPNKGSVKGLPLEHTFPDVENNMLRPVPAHLRKDLNEFNNPLQVVQRQGDEKLMKALKYIKNIKELEFSYKQEVMKEVEKEKKEIQKSITYNRYHIHVWILLYLFVFYIILTDGSAWIN